MKFSLIIIGSAMIGFLMAEVLGAVAKVRIEFMHNCWWALSFAVFAAGVAL